MSADLGKDDSMERIATAFERIADDVHGIRKHLESVDLWELSRLTSTLLENLVKTGRP